MSVNQVAIEVWNNKAISPLGGNLSDDETDTFHGPYTTSSSATSPPTGVVKPLTMDIFLQNYNSHQNKYDSDTFGPDTIAAFGAADFALSVPMGRGTAMASKSNLSPNTPTTEQSAREGNEMTEQLEHIHVAPPFDDGLNDSILNSEGKPKNCNDREIANKHHDQQCDPSSSIIQMQERQPVSQITIRYQENEEEGFESVSSQKDSIQTSFDDSGVPSDVLETSSSEEVSMMGQSLMERLPSPFFEKTKTASENSQEMELSKYLTPSEIETETREVFIDITNARRRPSTSQKMPSDKNEMNESLENMQKAFVDKFEQRQKRIDSVRHRREKHKSTQPLSAQSNEQCTILTTKDTTRDMIDLHIRQEAASRQTELEREAARSWAQAERESVRKWAEDQRNRTNTDTARANNIIVVPRRIAELRECQQRQEEVDDLRATIERLEMDLKHANDRYHKIEIQLKERIQEQTEKANKLEKLLMSKTSESSESNWSEKETNKENSRRQNNLAHVKNSKGTKELPRENNRGRTERVLGNGRKIITYGNGTEKEMFPDGTSVIRFLNGDIKMTYENDGVVVYYYATSKTTHTSYPDGSATFEFSNRQKEYHYPDGKKIVFVDGTKKTFYPTGKTEIDIPGGLHDVEKSDGTKEITQH